MLDGSKDSMGRDLQAVALRIQEKENDPLVMRSKIRLNARKEVIIFIFM